MRPLYQNPRKWQYKKKVLSCRNGVLKYTVAILGRIGYTLSIKSKKKQKMLIKLSTYERVAENLLKGQPKAKPFGKLKTKSLHWTKQSRNLQLFWRIKRTHRQLEY